MPDISFFVPKGPYNLSKLPKELGVQKKDIAITDVKTLVVKIPSVKNDKYLD